MVLEKLKEMGVHSPAKLSRFFQKHYRTGEIPRGREKLYKELMEETKWLPISSSYRHRWFILENNLKSYPKCEECGDPIIWNQNLPEDVERTTCGKKCSAIKRQRDYKETYRKAAKKGHANKDQKAIGRKISESRLSWDDDYREEIIRRSLKTKYDKGSYKTGRYKSDWQHYRSLVISMTRKVDISHLPNARKRGRCGVDGAYQLDHKVSLSEGFENNILPHVIADIDNLQMLPWLENSKKKAQPYAEWKENRAKELK